MTKRFAGRDVASDRECGAAGDGDSGPEADDCIGRCDGVGNEDDGDADGADRWKQSEQPDGLSRRR